MPVIDWITALTGIILCGALLIPISKKIGIPRDGLLLMIGFAASEVFTAQGYDTGLRWYYFRDLVFFGVLPLLVFNTALQVDTSIAKRELSSILFLAFPVRLITMALIGVVLFYGIGHPAGFPLVSAFLLAVMLTAPDPDSLIEHANLSKRHPRVCLILQGESLLGDVLAIVLFSLLLSMVMMAATLPSASELALQFVWVLFGGVMLGFIIGKLSEWLLTVVPTDPSKVIFLVSILYLSFVLAEEFFNVSGVVTMLLFGLTLSRSCSKIMGVTFKVFAEILTIGLFFLAGMTLTAAMFIDRWLAMLLAGLALILARGLGVYIFTFLTRISGKAAEHRLSPQENTFMMMAGVPGAVALALALSLPLDVPGWYTVQAAVYGVVIIGMLIQTPLTIIGVNRLRKA